MMTWKLACSLSTPCQALPLAWKLLKSLIFGSNRGKSLKGQQISSYTRFLSRRRRKSHLEPSMGEAIRMWLGHRIKLGLKGLIFSKIRKSEKVDVTIHPEEFEVMDDVLAAKYEEAREEEKLRNQKQTPTQWT
ncbi:hypothetical protein VPH35_113313 [Triticum aestivum]